MTVLDLPNPDRKPTTSGRRAVLTAASRVKRERVEWLWLGRVPLGMLTLLAGDPGLGKSLLTVSLAAQVSREGRNVILVAGEDSPGATVRPRLEAEEADLDRVTFLTVAMSGYEDGLRLPTDMVELDAAVAEEEARLVVIDPITAHLAETINSWSDQSIRTALAPLHTLARERGCAVVAVLHLNKSLSADALRRISGSVGFQGAARSVLLLARDPEDEPSGNRRVLAHIKCNVGPEQGSVAFQVEPVLIPARDGDPEVDTARLVEVGESSYTKHDLLAPADSEERSSRDEAEEFLQIELAEGARIDVRRIKRTSTQAGLSWRTVERAKARLGIISERHGGVGADGCWTWRLPGPPKTANAPGGLSDGGLGGLSGNPHQERDSDELGLLRPPSLDIGGLSANGAGESR
jgi:archaellum biogenesis ATPase FlaH